MFIRFIRHVRSQPKAVRDRYALTLSLGFTGLVVFLWLFTSASVRAPGSLAGESPEGSIPFASLVSQTKAQFASIKAAFQAGIRGQDNETSTTSEAVSADPRALILTEETVAGASSTTSWQDTSSSTIEYQEVQIITTTTPSVATST